MRRCGSCVFGVPRSLSAALLYRAVVFDPRTSLRSPRRALCPRCCAAQPDARLTPAPVDPLRCAEARRSSPRVVPPCPRIDPAVIGAKDAPRIGTVRPANARTSRIPRGTAEPPAFCTAMAAPHRGRHARGSGLQRRQRGRSQTARRKRKTREFCRRCDRLVMQQSALTAQHSPSPRSVCHADTHSQPPTCIISSIACCWHSRHMSSRTKPRNCKRGTVRSAVHRSTDGDRDAFVSLALWRRLGVPRARGSIDGGTLTPLLCAALLRSFIPVPRRAVCAHACSRRWGMRPHRSSRSVCELAQGGGVRGADEGE